jgi:hypothetical protein
MSASAGRYSQYLIHAGCRDPLLRVTLLSAIERRPILNL